MARLNDPLAAKRPVPQQSGGIARLRPEGPSDAEGRGIQTLGAGIESGMEEVFRAQKVEEDRLNTLRAEEAYTKLRERQLDLTLGEENGFGRIKGSEAVSRPILKEWSGRFDSVEQEILGGLSNDEQRQRFRLRANVSRLQFKEDILRHLAREGDAYEEQVFKGTVAVEQKNAVARWDSPNDIQTSLDRIKDQVDQRAKRLNWSPEYREAVLKTEHGKVHADVIQQAVASGNYKYGQDWYKLHRDDVDLATAKVLEKAVEDGTQKQLTNGYNAQYLAVDRNYRGLEALRQEVLGDKTLHEDRRNMIVGRIQGRMTALEHQGELARTRRERQIERATDQLNSNTLAGFEPSPEQFGPVLAAAKGTGQEAEVRSAIQLADATRAFRMAPPLQQEQMLTQAEVGIRTEPTKFDRRIVGAWRTIYDNQRRQVAENPISFVVQQGIVPPPQPLDLSNPPAAAAALHERFGLARGVSQRYQAPFKPLTTEEVKLLTSTLQGAPVEQQRNYFSALASAAGGDTQGYMAIMGQLAPDNPVTAIAGSLAARGRASSADLLLRGQSILRPSTKTDGKPDGSSLLPMPEEKDMRARFDSVVRDAFAGRGEARNAHYQAARAAYAALSVDAGDRDTKVLNNDRWEKAIETAIGKVENYRGRRVMLPTGYDFSQFRDGVQERLNDAAASGRLLPGWTTARLRDLPLENVGDGRYVLRSGDGVVMALPSHDKPILRNPDGSISTERTITIEAEGKHLILPTIVEGKQVPEAEAVRLWRAGQNKPVGTFATAAEAETAARARTEALGQALAPQPLIINFNVAAPTRDIPALPTPEELVEAERPYLGNVPERKKKK